MIDPVSEAGIVWAVADQAAERISWKTIAAFRKRLASLCRDGSGLGTVWDEICVQVQDEQSSCWEMYDHSVRKLIKGFVEGLPEHEKNALWLQTEEGSDWARTGADEREAAIVSIRQIVDHIAWQYVYHAAADWSNKRIEAYLDRTYQRD